MRLAGAKNGEPRADFRRVEETGEELVVTDNNVPVLRIAHGSLP